MKKAIIISGPTASGKTELAYTIAQNIPVVLINADSRQVYSDLDIVVGKDLPPESKFVRDNQLSTQSQLQFGYYQLNNTRLYFMDLVSPYQAYFSAHDYANAVKTILPNISKDKVPVFVGGSNFYISTLLNSVDSVNIPPNPKLRQQLSSLSISELRKKLLEVDKDRLLRMNESDGKNPRRLVRAIEVGEWRTKNDDTRQKSVLGGYEVFHIGLTAPIEYFRKKIDARVDTRISQGAIQEAEALFEHYDALSDAVKATNGYSQLFEYFKKNVGFEEAVQKWKYAEYHNAKKQLTWIHSDSTIKKYSLTHPHFTDLILHDMLQFISA